MMDDVKALTDHALEKKIAIIKVHGIELSFHPSAFIKEVMPSKPVKKLTPEEQLIADKAQLDADLFYSAE